MIVDHFGLTDDPKSLSNRTEESTTEPLSVEEKRIYHALAAPLNYSALDTSKKA